jgi:hypothetical protein
MKTKLYLVFLFWVFACVIPSTAQAVILIAPTDCGNWVKDRKDNGWLTRANQANLLGYLSGLAMARNKDFLRNTSNQSLFLWIDKYCQDNPLSNVYEGGLELSYVLQEKVDR